jgi:catechol 2,3-dioxygenase-like lactoylglutathione lyase family enzyme
LRIRDAAGAATLDGMTTDITGIVQATLAVTDLARSAAFYRDALGLTYAREFGDADEVTGCALADFGSGYAIALRRRDRTRGGGDMRGEHPVIVAVPDRPALDRVFGRLAAQGFHPTRGEHADADWVEIIDPDGICTRFAVAHAKPEFFGVRPDGFYATPRLELPPAA